MTRQPRTGIESGEMNTSMVGLLVDWIDAWSWEWMERCLSHGAQMGFTPKVFKVVHIMGRKYKKTELRDNLWWQRYVW